MTKAKRYEFFILSVTAGATGAVLYALVGVCILLAGETIWGLSPPAAVILPALLGGYCLFSIVSGILFAARWLAARPLKVKILLTVFFFVPVYLAILGIFYSIPYGIYNFARYRNTPADQSAGKKEPPYV